MPSIHDEEFGTITVRRTANARQVKISVAPNGLLRASLPQYTPLLFLRRLIRRSRTELRAMIAAATPKTEYYDGQQIGKRHMVLITEGTALDVQLKARRITVTLPPTLTITAPIVTARIREIVIKALRLEAKGYLPKRLASLADAMGCTYERVRFSHASSRWGSCSSTGTISLNIALMKLPFELIDYVLIHELAHTRQMNHSAAFWAIVSEYDPEYSAHKKRLAAETPSI